MGGGLKFDREYINNKKWKGKGYDLLNNIIYELKGGKGSIKEYCYDGFNIFEGDYLYGERNGKGKEYYPDNKLKFEGDYLNGKKSGKGKEYYDNGKLNFVGEYLNGQKNGYGK